MANLTLTEHNPFSGLNLPARYGASSLTPVKRQHLTLIAPLKGHSGAFPDIGKGTAELFWFAQNQWMSTRPMDTPATQTALVDQSDMWAAMDLTGEDAGATMARLCSLDLDRLAQGDVAQAEFAHVPAIILPVENGFRIMVMRSLISSVVQITVTAMKSVAAQELLD